MIDTSQTMPPTQALVDAWQAPAIDIARIRSALGSLWAEWELQNPGHDPLVVPVTAEQVYMRPSTLNVIAAVDTEDEAVRAERLLSALPDYAPSRSLILARHGLPAGSNRYSIRIKVEERQHHRGRTPVREEIITILAPPDNDEALASITSPLLVPDLPDVLYVPFGNVAGNQLAEHLFELVDSLLVDTVWTRQAGAVLAVMTDPQVLQDCSEISDIVWSRLGVWRQLVAQFFDQPAALPCLAAIEEVEIVYAPVNGGGRNGLTAGLLMAGWLATRLGWRAAGELVHGRNGWRSTLRSGERGKSREIVLSLREGSAPFSCSSLERVHLVSGPQAPGSFSVDRADEEGIATTSSHSTAAGVTRLVLSGCPEDRVLLGQELRQLHEDQTFLEALEFASILWPPGLDG